MATISKTAAAYTFAQVTETELTGADTFTYDGNAKLFIRNDSGAGATVNVVGSTATATAAYRPGGGTVDLSAGEDVTVGDGEIWFIQLGTIHDKLTGTISVTGGTASMYAFIV